MFIGGLFKELVKSASIGIGVTAGVVGGFGVTALMVDRFMMGRSDSTKSNHDRGYTMRGNFLNDPVQHLEFLEKVAAFSEEHGDMELTESATLLVKEARALARLREEDDLTEIADSVSEQED